MDMMEVQRERQFGAVSVNKMGQRGRNPDKTPVPRSSSPVTVYVELPCIVEQAFSTIAWGDLEESEVNQDKDSFGSQVNESDPNNHFFGGYTLDFLTDPPAMLESSLSPAELVPFQGCVIPPLTPHRDFSPQESSTETSNLQAQDGAYWRGMAQWHERALEHSTVVNKQLHETFHKQQEELDSLEERNLHLRQLASRAKHLASVIERLMTAGDHAGEAGMPYSDGPSLGPCKRQRVDEGYETESSDSVEDMLRDISTRCNAVLLSSTTGPKQQQEPETIRMHGAFSGLQMSTLSDRSLAAGGAETGDSVTSFRTSVREHCTIRTQVFPSGHAFTSRTQQGGYRFRWVPNQS